MRAVPNLDPVYTEFGDSDGTERKLLQGSLQVTIDAAEVFEANPQSMEEDICGVAPGEFVRQFMAGYAEMDPSQKLKDLTHFMQNAENRIALWANVVTVFKREIRRVQGAQD